MTPGKRVFSHDEAFPELGAFALGALSADEADAVAEHLAQCDVCTTELAAMYDTAASLSTAIGKEAVPMSPARSAAIRSELIERARLESQSRQSAGVNVPSVTRDDLNSGVRRIDSAPSVRAPSETRKAAVLSPLMITALAASVVFALLTVQQMNLAKTATQQSSVLSARVDSLEKELMANNILVTALAGKQVRVVELAAAGPVAPNARMFWDISTDRWTMFAHDLPALASDKVYQAWLIDTKGTKIPAGVFVPSPTGEALVQATYALGANDLAAIAVTVEPTGGSAQPTTTPIIVGQPGK